jgi:large subunit ribosomal protein L9
MRVGEAVLDNRTKPASIVGSASRRRIRNSASAAHIMPSTEIILTENIPGLGAEADVVKVRRGYARNFLLPQGKAYEVTKRSLRQLDNLKAKRAAREAAELNEAEELSRRIGKLKVVFTLETGETGKAFGSITAQDLVKRLKNELGNEIDRHRLVLDHPIKTTGEHEVPIKLHHEVTAKFIFQVKPAKEEAPALAAEQAGEVSEKARPFRKRTDTK